MTRQVGHRLTRIVTVLDLTREDSCYPYNPRATYILQTIIIRGGRSGTDREGEVTTWEADRLQLLPFAKHNSSLERPVLSAQLDCDMGAGQGIGDYFLEFQK